jgi:O-antigen ligase
VSDAAEAEAAPGPPPGPGLPAPSRPRALDRVLNWGLVAYLVAAPLPFGGVPPAGRAGLELGAAGLLVVWAACAARGGARLPPLPFLVGSCGLLAFTLVQALPLGAAAVGALSPTSLALRAESRPPVEIRLAEGSLLGVDPAALETGATLSVDPESTASALRTGALLVALVLVATTVAAACGVRTVLAALLVSACFQGLYGLLVVASATPRLWHVPKEHYLDSATGTFVNRNHFACHLAMALCCGLGLVLEELRRARGRGRWIDLVSATGPRAGLLALQFAVGLAGLLTSLSRAGITLGLAFLGTTLVAGKLSASQRGWSGLRARASIAALILGAALVPLLQIGSDRLLARYAASSDDLFMPGGRWAVWGDTLEMAAAFPLVGSGFGTFASVFPVFRSGEVRLFYAHAHNDLLQAAAEGGIVGTGLLLLPLVPLLVVVSRSLVGGKGPLAIGIAAGLSVILLHSLIDFNFHIPANAALAAVLTGSLFGLPWDPPHSR